MVAEPPAGKQTRESTPNQLVTILVVYLKACFVDAHLGVQRREEHRFFTLREALNTTMSVADRMHDKLTAAFSPLRLEIIDDSARHAGHSGARPGGETHFNVEIVADAFVGKSRLDRQRAIHAILEEELAGPVHALSVKAATPDEAGPS
jgi:BolA protein